MAKFLFLLVAVIFVSFLSAILYSLRCSINSMGQPSPINLKDTLEYIKNADDSVHSGEICSKIDILIDSKNDTQVILYLIDFLKDQHVHSHAKACIIYKIEDFNITLYDTEVKSTLYQLSQKSNDVGIRGIASKALNRLDKR